ncbi:MAG: hypothetical protein JRN52_13610 [Nitrososphaerota archaeon]|nr:hypothetical protein [Nitrososphaerota archaeon]
MSSEDIAKKCSFESRMAAAGVIALLRRKKAIELVPESYRLTEEGKNILEGKQQEQPKQEPKKPEPKQPKNQTKEQQIVILSRAFKILNPDRDPKEIDFQAVVDESLHVSENREVLAKMYPASVSQEKNCFRSSCVTLVGSFPSFLPIARTV